MSKKVYKIKKKGVKQPSLWKRLNWFERILLILLCITCLASVTFILWPGTFDFGQKAPTTELPANQPYYEDKSQYIATEGSWHQFDAFGLKVWVPSAVAKASPLSDLEAQYNYNAIERRSNNDPMHIFGTFVYPEQCTEIYSIESGSMKIYNAISDYLFEAVKPAIHFNTPTLNVSIEHITLADGVLRLKVEGHIQTQMTYTEVTGEKNRKDYYAQFYGIVQLVNGRPVVSWALWDYSAYPGVELLKPAVDDAAVSVSAIDGAQVADSFLSIMPLAAEDPIEEQRDMLGNVAPKYGYIDGNGDPWVDGQDGRYAVSENGYIYVDGKLIKVDNWEEMKEQLDRLNEELNDPANIVQGDQTSDDNEEENGHEH